VLRTSSITPSVATRIRSGARAAAWSVGPVEETLAVPTVEAPTEVTIVRSGRCTLPPALGAEKKPSCRSSHGETSRCIALIAISRGNRAGRRPHLEQGPASS
jgi:hypothetical protein